MQQGGMSAITATVARRYGVPIEDILGARRFKEIVEPRHVAMYLMRVSGYSFGHIADWVGRDKSTVIQGVRKVERLLDESEDMADLVVDLRGEIRACGCA
jgi:chromosomal replication initiator protein